MNKKLYIQMVLLLSLLLSGCGEDEGEGSSSTVAAQGWHFQGRDCLACHNVDLQEKRNLLVAGTLYKNSVVQNQDDLNEMCGGDLRVNFYDSQNPTTLIYTSGDYIDTASKGYQGKGNVFILKRLLPVISAGSYYVEITDQNGSILASKTLHNFSAQPYDINNPTDYANRISCNACHSPAKSAPQRPLYVYPSTAAALSLCK